MWYVFIIVCGVVGLHFVSHADQTLKIYHGLGDFPKLFANWDGRNYLEIAERGYQVELPHLYGFMPLYPLLIKIVSLIVPSILVSALLISPILFVIALFVLEKMMCQQTGSAILGRRTILSVLFFPTSFFFITAYTESLFLLLTVLSFYYLQQKKVVLMGIAVMLALVSRITGIVLAAVMIWELLRLKDIPVVKRLSALLIMPLALLILMLYLYVTTGDSLKFIHVQQTNFQTSTLHNPFVPLISYLINFSPVKLINQLDVIYFLDFVVAIGTIFILFAGRNKITNAQLLFGLGVWFLHLTTGRMNSFIRYILPVFPLFILLAFWGKKRWFQISYAVTGLGIGGLLFIWFLCGHWVA